ncbi:hypothetical protein VN97_g1730 [Penicillium thymicola]|uniref:ribonuclease H n=1 Tax=Penicillium thymicola TaxID=293382 RepID=A0AAI9TR08_PENTH|nr:hypothetical protein VN97_g1730 [Penicillium thymicola]
MARRRRYRLSLSLSAPRTELRVGRGRIFPRKFNAPNPNDTPKSLFALDTAESAIPPVDRFIRRNGENNQFLIYTDGACLDNGGANPRGGCCFVYKGSGRNSQSRGYASFALEKQGPTGTEHRHTSNRAELRAVIAATRFRHWVGEGCRSLVIATDSEYVVRGITTRVKRWVRNGWMTQAGTSVKNQDLWLCLLGEVERWHEQGMRIEFWRIPRKLNKKADRHAKEAAHKPNFDHFRDIAGVLV